MVARSTCKQPQLATAISRLGKLRLSFVGVRRGSPGGSAFFLQLSLHSPLEPRDGHAGEEVLACPPGREKLPKACSGFAIPLRQRPAITATSVERSGGGNAETNRAGTGYWDILSRCYFPSDRLIRVTARNPTDRLPRLDNLLERNSCNSFTRLQRLYARFTNPLRMLDTSKRNVVSLAYTDQYRCGRPLLSTEKSGGSCRSQDWEGIAHGQICSVVACEKATHTRPALRAFLHPR